jgi:hypothetical protein
LIIRNIYRKIILLIKQESYFCGVLFDLIQNMRKAVVIFFLLCTVFLGYAQPDIINNTGGVNLKMKPVTPNPNPVVEEKLESLPEEPLLQPLEAPVAPPVQPKTGMVQENKFANPNLPTLQKLNGQNIEADIPASFAGDKFFGDYRSNGKFVKIVCRDFGQVDGDRVSLYLNDKLLLEDLTLVGSYTELKINLSPGFNKIEFKAMNQGTLGPNTAEFQMFDDKGKTITFNQWNLLTGTKASIIVVKE